MRGSIKKKIVHLYLSMRQCVIYQVCDILLHGYLRTIEPKKPRTQLTLLYYSGRFFFLFLDVSEAAVWYRALQSMFLSK